MKSYSIGREETCNIIVNDPTQMVSRRHATLNVDGRKMTIVDSSSNGTYINGIRIQSGSPVPVTRKDVVSFAQVAELDWKCIPDESGRKLGYALAILAVLLLVGGGTWYFLEKNNEKQNVTMHQEEDAWQNLTKKVDSLKTAIPILTADVKSCTDSLATVKTQLEKKDISDKNTKEKSELVKKDIWQIEELLKGIDVEDLRKSLDSVVQSLGDKSGNTASRVESLDKKVKAGQGSVKKMKDLFKEISQELSGMKDKPSGGAGKKVTEEKKEPERNVAAGL